MPIRSEHVLAAVALGLIGTVGVMAVKTQQQRAERDAARAERLAHAEAADQENPASSGSGTQQPPTPAAPSIVPAGTVQPSDLGALPLRAAALPAPTRDVGAIQRALRTRGAGTYIQDLLAQQDSMLIRWPDRTVAALRVWVQPRSTVPAWSDAYAGMVRDVFPEWSAAGFPIRFLHVLDSASADLHVTFTTAFSGRRIGETRLFRDANGWIVAAQIIIGTQDQRGRALPASLVSGIARHELGHALGLAHTRDRSAIMYPEAVTTVIGAADRATLRLLYELPPGDVR